MEGSTRLNIYNMCRFDIGVILMNGTQVNITAGHSVSMTVDDILFIEANCNRRKVFSSHMLEIRTTDHPGRVLSLEDLGGYTDQYTEENQKHYSDEEIETMLKKPFKAFEAWVKKIDNQSELEAISKVAEKIDLPGSKLKVLQAKMPNKDLLELEEDADAE